MKDALLRTAIKIALLAGLAVLPLPRTWAEDAPASKLVAIPPDKDTDIKFYAADGSVVTGTDALARMPNADLTLWVAGNQFFAMDEVIGALVCETPSPTPSASLRIVSTGKPRIAIWPLSPA